MKPYHPANLDLQPYSPWKVIALSWLAKAVGVQIKINGIPFGASAYSPCQQCERRRSVPSDGSIPTHALKCTECGLVYAAHEKEVCSSQKFSAVQF